MSHWACKLLWDMPLEGGEKLVGWGILWGLVNWILDSAIAYCAGAISSCDANVSRLGGGAGQGNPSADGRLLSFVDWETGDVAVRDLTTGQNLRLTRKGSWSQSPEFAEWPKISPDGKKVVYSWVTPEYGAPRPATRSSARLKRRSRRPHPSRELTAKASSAKSPSTEWCSKITSFESLHNGSRS